jgi:glycosyltransferase involved in cell wall biosynthesis
MVGPPEGLLTEQLRANNVPVLVVPALEKPLNPLRDLASLLQIVSALRLRKPDILATHTSKAGFIGRIAAKLTGVPSFFTPHGWSFISRKNGRPIRFRLFLEQLASSLGGRVIAVCDAERKLALACLGIKSENISTIHHGLPDCVLPSKRRNPPVVITMVARFYPPKDHNTLLQALATLTHLDWEVRLAGDGPLLLSTKILTEKLGLSSRVHFLNQCSEIPSLLAESDIFALISNSEAFPISVLEAMRSGLPVVATSLEGVREAVEDGVSGFLVPRHDVFHLAEKLALLIASPRLRTKLGAEGRLRFNQHFEWRSMLDKTEAVYAEAVPNAVLSRTASATSA